MSEVIQFEKSASLHAQENACEFAESVAEGMGVKASLVAWVGDDGQVYWQADENTPEDAVNTIASVMVTVTALQLRGVPEGEE